MRITLIVQSTVRFTGDSYMEKLSYDNNKKIKNKILKRTFNIHGQLASPMKRKNVRIIAITNPHVQLIHKKSVKLTRDTYNSKKTKINESKLILVKNKKPIRSETYCSYMKKPVLRRKAYRLASPAQDRLARAGGWGECTVSLALAAEATTSLTTHKCYKPP